MSSPKAASGTTGAAFEDRATGTVWSVCDEDEHPDCKPPWILIHLPVVPARRESAEDHGRSDERLE